MPKITLKGRNEGLEVEFSPAKHVELTSGFYEKTDTDNVVLINSRYYRKNSPLIAQLSEKIYGKNRFCLLAEAVIDSVTGDTIHVSESSSVGNNSHFIFSDEKGDIIPIKHGEKVYYNTKWSTIRYSGPVGELIEANVSNDSTSNALRSGVLINKGGRLLFAKHTFSLHSSYRVNGPATFLGVIVHAGKFALSVQDLLDNNILIDAGGYHWARDIQYSTDPIGNKYKPIRNQSTGFRIDNRDNPFSNSSNIVRSDIRELMIASIKSRSKSGINTVLKSFWFGDNRLDSDFETRNYMTKFNLFCGSKEDAKLLDSFYDVCSSGNKFEVLQDYISKNNWMGEDIGDQAPKLYTGNNVGPQGGDYSYFSAQRTAIIDENNSETGSIGFTFGVEIETEKGVVPLEVVKSLNISAVGDRSIGGLEYVTGILSGNSGINKLQSIVETISDYCMVADTCGIHVHVGSDNGKWSPRFDKEFSVLAIKVGCAIEKELFSLLPSNRMDRVNSNGQSYCGSILAFHDINMKNWKDRLFSYVFGRNVEDPSENFSSLDSLIESRHQVSRWGAGRYKWLNLINCTTDNSGRRNGGGFQTIEFRAFNGTLNFNDIKAFVLLSLSFVQFIELNRKEIMDLRKISIMGIAGSTMSGPALDFFTEWYRERVNRIQRAYERKSNTTVKSI